MKKTTLSTLLAVALGTAAAGNANAFTLTSGNASVDGDRLGLSSWTQGGTNHLAAQNWWFNASTNVGSTPYNYELADYDAAPTETTQGANNATVAYDFAAELGLTVGIDYTLSGGPGTSSSLSENIQITNNTAGIASFTLYQYTDFDLGGYSPYDSNADDVGNGTDSLNYGQTDTVEQVTANFVRQTNGAMTATEAATVPVPGLTSIGNAITLEDALFDGTVTGTADGNTFTGDAAWIWAYTFTIADGDTASISKSLVLDAVVPVPAAVWLFGSGLLGLVGIARRRT